MKKNYILLSISIVEIVRWISIYLFFNFVKLKLSMNALISNENFLWFGSTFIINILFAIFGILIFLKTEKYLIVSSLWSIYKLVFIIFVIILLFLDKINAVTYFLIFAPLDFFIFLYLIILPKTINDAVKTEDSKVDGQ